MQRIHATASFRQFNVFGRSQNNSRGFPRSAGSQRVLMPLVRCGAEAAPKQPEVVTLPASKQDAVKAAAKSILLQVPPTVAKKSKRGFKKSAVSRRVAVEIPVAGTNATETVELAAEALAELGSKAGKFTVVFAKEEAARAAKGRLPGVSMELREACRCSQITGSLMLVGPDASDVALVEQLVEEVWQGEVAVVLNSEWGEATIPPEFRALVDSFEVTYSFLPVAVQGMLGSVKEGAVLRHVVTKDASQTPWEVLYCDKGQYIKVMSKPQRPNAKDLELVFYNVTAATSPVAQTVGKAASFFKNIMPKGKGS